jgi:anti-sigma B factor antagonist
MQLTELRQGNVVVLAVRGRLDALTAPELLQRGSALFARGDRCLLIDCSNLEYLSSGGVRAFFALGRQVPAGGTLAFAGPDANVRKVMVMVELDRDYTVYADVPAALTALAETGG